MCAVGSSCIEYFANTNEIPVCMAKRAKFSLMMLCCVRAALCMPSYVTMRKTIFLFGFT